MMGKRPPKIIRYRRHILRLAEPEQEETEDVRADVVSEMGRALQALVSLGGSWTKKNVGKARELQDGGEPWSIEMILPLFDLVPKNDKLQDILKPFPYREIGWRGWVSARIINGELRIEAEGTVSFDNNWFDDQAQVMSKNDLLRGMWDGSTWSWALGVR